MSRDRKLPKGFEDLELKWQGKPESNQVMFHECGCCHRWMCLGRLVDMVKLPPVTIFVCNNCGWKLEHCVIHADEHMPHELN